MVISYVVNATYMFLWDVIVDWGLLDFKAKDNPGLRDELVYRYRAYYYGAILEDLVIRFSWIGILVCQYAHLAELEIVRTVVYFAELSRYLLPLSACHFCTVFAFEAKFVLLFIIITLTLLLVAVVIVVIVVASTFLIGLR
ncbi:unnamed protein product [Dibothriocephalus latus]|uniref:EXS domain-containing protein n=1 Tax=Dibothriocephalus latus TaxID=60516 RepID=A0A3P7NFU4_DIBLA|nr:unnamed protein product [Dibothriocephalus latus]